MKDPKGPSDILISSMIGSISNASYASYGSLRSSQAGRVHGDPESQAEEKKGLTGAEADKKKAEQEKVSNPQQLDDDEKQQVEELKQRDAEVRSHEQAHMAAAGNLAMGGPNYVFQTGPDGRQYAIGGDVKIDTSPGRTPEESARKAQQIRAAALAPADPSAQDLKVAAAASNMEVESASKHADQSEKNSDRKSQSSDASDNGTKGEITSSRQVFAPTASDSQDSEQNEGETPPRQNLYMMQAAKLYPSQQEQTPEPLAR